VKTALVVVLALAIPAHAHAKGCHEVSQVVGYEHCTWFGTWSRDTDVWPFWMDIAYYQHSYTSEPFALDASARGDGGSLATTAQGGMMRMLAGRIIYVGVEVGGGALTTLPTTGAGAQPHTGGEMEGHLIGGVHVSLWRLGLAAEVAFGGRAQMLATCDAKADPGCMPLQDLQARRELQLRAHVDLFLAPRWSLGVTLGKSVLDAGDQELLITTGIHVRALDGAP